MRLNVQWDPTFYLVHLSNYNQLFPNTKELFGSDAFVLDVSGIVRTAEATNFIQDCKIRRTRWKLLDIPTKRCDMSNTEANTTMCLTKYMEETVGCSMGLASSDPAIER